jgi:hypothetical protein
VCVWERKRNTNPSETIINSSTHNFFPSFLSLHMLTCQLFHKVYCSSILAVCNVGMYMMCLTVQWRQFCQVSRAIYPLLTDINGKQINQSLLQRQGINQNFFNKLPLGSCLWGVRSPHKPKTSAWPSCQNIIDKYTIQIIKIPQKSLHEILNIYIKYMKHTKLINYRFYFFNSALLFSCSMKQTELQNANFIRTLKYHSTHTKLIKFLCSIYSSV